MVTGNPGTTLLDAARLATPSPSPGWSTPQASDSIRGVSEVHFNRQKEKGHGAANLVHEASLSGWPTPTAALGSKAVRTPEGAIREALRAKGPDLAAVAGLAQSPSLAGWATPTATEAGGTPEQMLERKRRAVANGSSLGVAVTVLSLQAQLAEPTLPGWVSPASRDWKDSPGMATTATNPDGSERSRLDQLPRQAQLAASGETPSGSTAATGSGGQLSPVLPCWLMALPVAWVLAAPKKRRK